MWKARNDGTTECRLNFPPWILFQVDWAAALDKLIFGGQKDKYPEAVCSRKQNSFICSLGYANNPTNKHQTSLGWETTPYNDYNI